jgi:rubrerythrin
MALQVDFSRLDQQDVLDLAIQVEQEAEDNYLQLADWVGRDGNREASEFFVRMAKLEAGHRRQLADRRQELFGDAPARHSAKAAWEVEQPDWAAIGRTVGLAQAFELGMEAERRAGEYYSEAVSYASDPAVIELFRALAKAEEEHLRMLRNQRDRAFGRPAED